MSVITATIIGAVLVVSPFSRGPSEYQSASRIVFSTSLRDFIALVGDPGHDSRLVWDSDKCSAPLLGSAGKTYDFSDACRRHDFAYRNLSRVDNGRRWTSTLRNRVDNVFRRDMDTGCAARPKVQRAACRAWARLYFSAVRQFAGP